MRSASGQREGATNRLHHCTLNSQSNPQNNPGAEGVNSGTLARIQGSWADPPIGASATEPRQETRFVKQPIRNRHHLIRAQSNYQEYAGYRGVERHWMGWSRRVLGSNLGSAEKRPARRKVRSALASAHHPKCEALPKTNAAHVRRWPMRTSVLATLHPE